MNVSPIATNQSQEIKRVGVIGGGQLAWMMADAAAKLGVKLLIQTPKSTDPAATVAADIVLASIDDALATAELANRADAITFENEFIDLEALSTLEKQGVIFRPSLSALAPLLDKYHQRCYLRDLGLPTPKFWEGGIINREDSNTKAGEHQLPITNYQLPIPFPVVLKARRHGYDGQGTFIIKDEASLKSIMAKLGNQPLLLEEFVPFDRELAIIAARSVTGEVAIYPIVETQQENQVCRRVIAPADVSLEVAKQAEAIAHSLLNSLQAVGIFGIELFLTKDDKVLVNEIAPRTHNSGHFTIDACETSQFEQHLRAVCQLPLGKTSLNCDGAIMVNLLGYENAQSDYLTKREKLAQIRGAYVHWYGKSESRPGRKLGHVTVVQDARSHGDRRDEAMAIAQTIESIWYAS
ncbi:5-(carboxyamino)imidazole ribonucleotide synthase [Kamptonema animale CS-326]|jgi:5-(carboxyamino)imidazole ribonucleotide synthase|uniref:5-(carboxyamino)imidazole ribonucleotide synthase n=1 Tax=Kamptonema animale TaxID=92934 RepID=UPI00232F9685|nr:5-(carboxyamino)imidazole ribonucleotide synthase [Kamptonema animale]MDB9510786.1 5-(carboxyamino)imidazole ribonucleotide synthase [Kamptonema animale CS-326]